MATVNVSATQGKTLVFDDSLNFSLQNFEGPLELLLYLIQRDEMNICEITLNELTKQILEALEQCDEIDKGAEMLGISSTLLLLKSHKLLPIDGISQEEELNRTELIQQLIEYCHFRETAKKLSAREEEQQAFFPRQAPPLKKELGDGLEEINLSDLRQLLHDMMARSKQESNASIRDEIWHVSDKITWLRTLGNKNAFKEIFAAAKPRGELIVCFLALLELMKLGELKVVKEKEEFYIIR